VLFRSSMIIACVGSRYAVTGSRIAIVAAGPKAGRTPTKVPITLPKKQYQRFMGLKALTNPSNNPNSIYPSPI
jgi:hypothetical protein